MKSWLSQNVIVAVTAIAAFLNVNSTWADSHPENQFSVVIGSKDQLVVFAPNGEKAAELNPPAIAQSVKVGSSTVQVSYGRDANDLWTVILSSNPASPQPMNFVALDNKIEADKNSAVTLTFSKDLKKVSIDPGYLGTVTVNDTRITNTVVLTAHATVPPPAPVVPVVAPRPEEPSVVSTAPAPTTTTTSTATATTTSSETLPNGDEAAPKAVESAIPAVTYLNPQATFWSEPVTPPNPSDLPQVGSTDIKLLEVKGTVTVVLQPGGGDVPATSGMTIPTGATVKTGPDGSVAALLGGVNSTRFLPDSQATLNQSVADGKRETVVDLKNGVVFANVGQRSGETQDFKVKTPGGVAAAKGTAYVVRVVNGRLYVATLNGSVLVTDINGKLIGTSTPSAPGVPGIVSTEGSSETANNAVLAVLLAKVQAFNSKVNALMSKDPADLTQQEKDWLLRVPRIAERYAKILNDALKTVGVPGEPGFGGARGIGPSGGGFNPAPGGGMNFNPNAIITATTPS